MNADKSMGWQEQLRTGGARSLFTSYPDDEELARKIADLFREVPAPTAEQIRRDRQRFLSRPQKGEEIDEQEASPTKYVILNKASQLNVRESLAEILDNVFDSYQRNKPERLSIEIVVYQPTSAAPGEILMTETSGGIERQRIVPLIQLGFSERSVKGIGAWGEGFKMAAFALGEEIEVFSTYPGEDPIGIHFPRGWLDPGHSYWKKWKVNTYKVDQNPPPPGTTVIRISHLHESVLSILGLSAVGDTSKQEEKCAELADYFGEVYAEKYHQLASEGYGQISARLTIGTATREIIFKKRVKERLRETLAFLPWLRPIHWTTSWETSVPDPSSTDSSKERRAVLKGEIYAGLAASFDYSKLYPPQVPGVEMWGNGRLFSLKGRVADRSVGWGYVFGGSGGTNPQSNASSRRLMIVMLFSADDPRDIPWAAPVKTDYNTRSEFYAEIQLACAKVIRLYKDGLRLIESRLVPFSYGWSKLSEAQKLTVLFEDSDASSDFKHSFAQSRFGRKLLGFQADLTFHEITDTQAQVTVASIQGVSSKIIKDAVEAAAETKGSAEEVVQYLKALFPMLAKQAEIEEQMGLTADEELEL
ncbi:MAG: hypothetical protein AB1512_24410 [Thermodesulfobacteriota bacterium]